jgi:hypothetical protein
MIFVSFGLLPSFQHLLRHYISKHKVLEIWLKEAIAEQVDSFSYLSNLNNITTIEINRNSH